MVDVVMVVVIVPVTVKLRRRRRFQLTKAIRFCLTALFSSVNDKTVRKTRKSVDGEPSHIPALIKANRIEASYFLAYVAKYG